MKPYFDDGTVQLYHGDYREVLGSIDVRADLVCTDPPYQENSLEWDVWPDGWPAVLAGYASSMWVFGSMRMFLDRRDEFDAWRMSQDVVWEKNAPSFNPGDRFSRIHEHALHWYRGAWADVYHVPDKPTARQSRAGGTLRRSATAPNIQGERGAHAVTLEDNVYRTSVMYAANMRRQAATINATQKPEGILTPLIEYGCPPGGLVLDPFAGSCSTLITARNTGRRAIGVEAREEQCETAALRLSQGTLEFG